MFGMGFQELFIVMGILLLLFGAKRLPEIGKGLGQSLSSFKKGLKESQEENEK